MAKGKAREFSDLILVAKLQKPSPFIGANFQCEVNFDGQATLSRGGSSVLQLDSNDALALGQWLVDNFKT